MSIAHSVIFPSVHPLHSHLHQKQSQSQLFLASQPNKDLKQFLEKHQLQSLVGQLFCCVVASAMQKQSAYNCSKTGVHPSPVCAEAAVFPCSRSSPHTSLWHVDSIIAHGSLQGTNTAFWDNSLSATHTFSLCFLEAHFWEHFAFHHPVVLSLSSLHYCDEPTPFVLLLFLTCTDLGSKPLFYLKFSYWSYKTDSKSKRDLFLCQDRTFQLKKKEQKTSLNTNETPRALAEERNRHAAAKHF